ILSSSPWKFQFSHFADFMDDAFAHLTFSFLFNLNSGAIRVSDDKGSPVTKLILLIRNHGGRDKINLSREQIPSSLVSALGYQHRLSMDHIVGMLVHWKGTAVARRKVLKQFDARPGASPQRCNT